MDDPRETESDAFELYDLRVEVVGAEKDMVCNHRPGDYFELRGENLSLPPGQSFPIYPSRRCFPSCPRSSGRRTPTTG